MREKRVVLVFELCTWIWLVEKEYYTKILLKVKEHEILFTGLICNMINLFRKQIFLRKMLQSHKTNHGDTAKHFHWLHQILVFVAIAWNLFPCPCILFDFTDLKFKMLSSFRMFCSCPLFVDAFEQQLKQNLFRKQNNLVPIS